MELFKTSIDSPFVIIITIAFFIVSAITTFDIRIIQAQKEGIDEPSLPNWVAGLYWLNWIFSISIILLNWKYAIAVFIVRFILKITPVLETIGYYLVNRFRQQS